MYNKTSYLDLFIFPCGIGLRIIVIKKQIPLNYYLTLLLLDKNIVNGILKFTYKIMT